MANVLFVDACARGWEVSYTYAVAEEFNEEYCKQHPHDVLDELTLTDEHLEFFTGKLLEKRDRLLKSGALTDPFFRLARQFAAADKIIIAAPYWDLSFPALLKVYIEHLCVNGITFCYGEGGREIGLCKAEKLLFISTSGGAFTPEDMEMRGTGIAYLKAICRMFGIAKFEFLWAQGLDLVENDRLALVDGAKEKAVAFAQNW